MINKLKNSKSLPATLRYTRRAGFTILESLVAITVLSLSIGGAFAAVQQSLSQSIVSKEEVQAFYLAQEATEVVRNKRDNNQLTRVNNSFSYPWLSGITDVGNCPFGDICRADAVAMSLVRCGSSWGSCESLKQNSSTFLYGYSSGSVSEFKREMQLEPITISGNTVGIVISVRVTWSKGTGNYEFKNKTILYNWI